MLRERVSVMHLVDSLAIGGTERVAVNLANRLPKNEYAISLCTTRGEGPLATEVAHDVGRLQLNRRSTFDARAIVRLVQFIRHQNISLLHAHSSAIFVAVIASRLPPFPKVIWHDHYGRHGVRPRPVLPYWMLSRGVHGVISVSEALAQWSEQVLRVPGEKVWYVPNFVSPPAPVNEPITLPGVAGRRIVCVANLRPEKDHLMLLRAMARVVQAEPDTHLFVVGAASEQSYRETLIHEADRLGLSANVSWLGSVHNVYPILHACDIGVLSSASEGLPLALIEYGMAGLPVVATQVGQCATVLDDGKAGLLVPPGMPDALATQLLALLRSPDERAHLGATLKRRTESMYSAEVVLGKIQAIYQQVLGPDVVRAEELPQRSR